MRNLTQKRDRVFQSAPSKVPHIGIWVILKTLNGRYNFLLRENFPVGCLSVGLGHYFKRFRDVESDVGYRVLKKRKKGLEDWVFDHVDI